MKKGRLDKGPQRCHICHRIATCVVKFQPTCAQCALKLSMEKK